MRLAAALVFLLLTIACVRRMHSTSALLLSSQNHRLFLRTDCEPGRGPCVPGTPVSALDYVDRRYQNFRESGFIDLDGDMRLRVVAPIMRAGADGSPLIASASSRTGPQQLSVAVLASPDLLGYETAIYTLRSAQNGVAAALVSIQAKPISGLESGLPKTDYLQVLSLPRFLRLYFQLKRSGFDHDSALLAASSTSALDQASRQFEKDPVFVCGIRGSNTDAAQCITLPRGVVMNPELAIRVRERTVYIPIESTLEDALRAASVQNPGSLVRSIRISRRLGVREIPIRFDRHSDDVLGLLLVGGDRITW